MNEPRGAMPKGAGTAVLTTRTRGGATQRTPVWLGRISSDLDVNISVAQLRAGAKQRPVRIAERFLDLTVLFAKQHEDRYRDLVGFIVAHWAFNLNKQAAVPMVLFYREGKVNYRGYIEETPRKVSFDQVVLEFDLRMRLVQNPEVTATFLGASPMWAPNPDDVVSYGADWYSAAELIKQAGELDQIPRYDPTTGSITTPGSTSGSDSTKQPAPRHRHRKPPSGGGSSGGGGSGSHTGRPDGNTLPIPVPPGGTGWASEWFADRANADAFAARVGTETNDPATWANSKIHINTVSDGYTVVWFHQGG